METSAMLIVVLGVVLLLVVLACNMPVRTAILTSSSNHKEPFTPTTLRDVYHTAFVLRQKLPAELVTEILDYAECWVKSSTSCIYHLGITERDTRVGDSQEMRGVLYHTSALIAGTYEHLSALHPVRRVVFTISSRDQGWSNYRDCYGTYRGSWSWFEAEVLHQPETEVDAVPPRYITCNIHAGQDFHTHVIEWNYISEDVEESTWIQKLRRGTRIGVNAWARYPGWTNRVRSATIDVYTRGVRWFKLFGV